CTGHVRMQGAKVLVGARCRKCEREFLLAVERLRADRRRRDDGMGNVVFVSPGHGGAGLHRELLRAEGEIGDLHLAVARQSWHDGKMKPKSESEGGGQHEPRERTCHCHQPLSGVSTMASRCSFCLKVTLAVPSIFSSWSAGTFIGPAEGAAPGAGCGKAV